MSFTNDQVKTINKMCPVAKALGLGTEVKRLGDALEVIDPTQGEGVIEQIAALETTVGDETAGLVKDVADLEATIGDGDAGLVKDVADLKVMVGEPTLVGATIDGTKKLVDMEMSTVIYSALSFEPIGMKANITVAEDGETFEALGESDSINLSGKILRVAFNAALTTATNKIKVAAGTLVSVGGAENAEIITDAIDATVE